MKPYVFASYSVLFALICVFTTPASGAEKRKKSSLSAASASGVQSTTQVYHDLSMQQKHIGQQISDLSLQLHSASKAKNKKLTRQINLLSDDLVVVERKLAAFPSAYTGAVVSSGEPLDDGFRRQLDSVAAVRVAASNPFAGQLSSDPELERMYRAYLKQFGGDGVGGSSSVAVGSSGGVTFRVMVAISKVRLAPSQFSGMDQVVEQAMPRGGYAYYVGAYRSYSEASSACDRILAQHRFRDAFVVAMEGDRRVPLKR